jgi:D-2-hydroxyacid dehydrogenase (NADP+)
MADVLILYQKSDKVPMVLTSEHINKIRNAAKGIVECCKTEDEALEKGYDYEVLFLWGGSGEMPVKYCMQSKKLKWIHSFSAGVNPIMESDIITCPVILTNAKGIHGKTMALTTMGYIISFLRNFREIFEKQRKHVWSKQFSTPLRETSGLTVAVIGAGSIGTAVANYSKAFGMRTIGVKRNVYKIDGFDEVIPLAQIEDAVREADFVVITLPLTQKTEHLFNRKLISCMKRSAYLINIARGKIVDESALIDALKEGTIAGAALDATEDEPLSPISPLWDMDNVIISPHCSADSTLYMDRAVDQFCKNLIRYDKGEQLLNEININDR